MVIEDKECGKYNVDTEILAKIRKKQRIASNIKRTDEKNNYSQII